MVRGLHRRRIYTEEEAKVVAAAWGTEVLQFLPAKAIFHQDDLKNRMKTFNFSNRPGETILFYKSFWCEIASTARNLSSFVPQASATTLVFSYV